MLESENAQEPMLNYPRLHPAGDNVGIARGFPHSRASDDPMTGCHCGRTEILDRREPSRNLKIRLNFRERACVRN